MNSHFLNDFLYPKSIAFFGANNKGTGIASFQVMNLIVITVRAMAKICDYVDYRQKIFTES